MPDVTAQSDVHEALPAPLAAAWGDLRAQTLDNARPLNVCLVGAFSVGKSSLVNMLLGRDLLPTALSETTSLPTFLEHGPDWAFRSIVGGEEAAIPLEAFQRLAVEGGPPDAFLVGAVPAPWLAGICLVDLPGTGGTESARREFAAAQIRSADAMIYLLSPRGPGAEDLALLRLAHTLGKTLFVAVSQWDAALAASERAGEPLADLAEWAEAIAEATSLRTTLVPTSRTGIGRDELLAFLARVAGERRAVRQRRYVREAERLLDQALGMLADERGTLAAESDAAIEALRDELRARRDLLLRLRGELSAQREDDRQKLADERVAKVATGRRALQRELEGLEKELGRGLGADTPRSGEAMEAAISAFLEGANQAAETSVIALARTHVDLHGRFGTPPALDASFDGLKLRLPPAPDLDAEVFLDAGASQALEQQLVSLMTEIERGERELPAAVDPSRKAALLEDLRALDLERHELETRTLQTIERKFEGTGNGKIVGRIVGEILDVALLFVPAAGAGAAAAKVASAVGQGAQAAKVARAVATGTQFAKTVVAMNKGVSTTCEDEEPRSLGMQALEKASFLQMLSAGYWGEKVGAWFDTPPRTVVVADPRAVAERDRALEQKRYQAHQLAAQVEELQRAIDDGKLSAYVLERRREEHRQLEQKLGEARDQAAEDAQRAAAEAAAQYAASVRLRAGHALRSALATYDQKATGMGNCLTATFKAHWESRVAGALADHERHLAHLEATLGRSPDERRQALGHVDERIRAVQVARAELG